MVVFKDGKCIMHAGFMGRGTVAGAGKPGAICKAVQSSGKSNYLANLVLFPGERTMSY